MSRKFSCLIQLAGSAVKLSATQEKFELAFKSNVSTRGKTEL